MNVWRRHFGVLTSAGIGLCKREINVYLEIGQKKNDRAFRMGSSKNHSIIKTRLPIDHNRSIALFAELELGGPEIGNIGEYVYVRASGEM